MFGYNGRFLRVNLSEEKITVEEPAEDYYKRYMGAGGLLPLLCCKRCPEGSILWPGEQAYLCPGPITGMPIPGSGRNSVGAKSPLTGGFGEAEAGGFFGAELKRAAMMRSSSKGLRSRPLPVDQGREGGAA